MPKVTCKNPDCETEYRPESSDATEWECPECGTKP